PVGAVARGDPAPGRGTGEARHDRHRDGESGAYARSRSAGDERVRELERFVTAPAEGGTHGLNPPWQLGYVPAGVLSDAGLPSWPRLRSEEHTSELQSRENLVCRLL